VLGDAVVPFMASPDTDPVAVREADAPAFRPGDPAAAPRRSNGGEPLPPAPPVLAEMARCTAERGNV
jgi:hypothetical protein